MYRSVTLCLLVLLGQQSHADDLSTWTKPAAPAVVAVAGGKAELAAPDWSFLRGKTNHDHVALEATCTILEPAKRLDYFGSSWNVWPSPTYPDQGYEVGLLLRASENSGYRVQLSHRYQCLTLTKYPDGGFVRSVPLKIELKKPLQVRAVVHGNQVIVAVEGVEKLRFRDDLLPLRKGQLGLGTSSQAKVAFENVRVTELTAIADLPADEHKPDLRVRKFHGDRPWVFDGDEPIVMLPTPESDTVNNVKLRPGYKPQLSWNSPWDISNQQVFKDGLSKNGPTTTSGGGDRVKAAWTARQLKDRFQTRSELTVSWNAKRGTYVYDIDSELEVLGQPFAFQYGYDFEHHTPLDPFRWQHLVVKRGGQLQRRPLAPFDPGVMEDVDQQQGLRLWYGRAGDHFVVAPAVEYDIPDPKKRKMHTAVCAAFYDTGVALAQETAPAGTKVKVRYRYAGYPAAEAKALFDRSVVWPEARVNPKKHFVFADAWPKLTFTKFVRLDEPWWGGRPFLSGHNAEPTYELEKHGTGFALRFPPLANAVAALPAPGPLTKGRYVVSALARVDNAHGPGGYLDVLAVNQASDNGYLRLAAKVLKEERHFIGAGTFGWKRVGFVTEVPSEAKAIGIGLGNAGTGDVSFAEIEVRPLKDGEQPGEGIALSAQGTSSSKALAGAIVDYRMQEGRGQHVYNYAAGRLDCLELANLDWVTDEGRPALKFADNRSDKATYPRGGTLERGYFHHPAYKDRDRLPVAIAGHHGGGNEYRALTVATWVKPAATMPTGHSGTPDIVGFGARRLKLSLQGTKAPYTLGTSMSYQDYLWSEVKLNADRWYHVAVTGQEENGKWRLKLYLDGKLVKEGVTQKATAPQLMPPSLVLGAELFYLHDAYYRGLIGRTLVFEKALKAEDVARLAAER